MPVTQPPAAQMAELGPATQRWLPEAGGLTQFGACIETLEPGSRSSARHWHEAEDELLCVLGGEATVIEDDGEPSSPPAMPRSGPQGWRTPTRS